MLPLADFIVSTDPDEVSYWKRVWLHFLFDMQWCLFLRRDPAIVSRPAKSKQSKNVNDGVKKLLGTRVEEFLKEGYWIEYVPIDQSICVKAHNPTLRSLEIQLRKAASGSRKP